MSSVDSPKLPRGIPLGKLITIGGVPSDTSCTVMWSINIASKSNPEPDWRLVAIPCKFKQVEYDLGRVVVDIGFVESAFPISDYGISWVLKYGT